MSSRIRPAATRDRLAPRGNLAGARASDRYLITQQTFPLRLPRRDSSSESLGSLRNGWGWKVSARGRPGRGGVGTARKRLGLVFGEGRALAGRART